MQSGRHRENLTVAILGPAFLLLLLVWSFGATSGHASSEALIVIELEGKDNRLDGCTDCGCRLLGEVPPGTKRVWWSTFGVVRPDGAGGWEPVAPSSLCGEGRLDLATGHFTDVVGFPYVVGNYSVEVRSLANGRTHLQGQLEIHRFTGFDARGEPKYTGGVQARNLRFTEEVETAFPVLLADSDEREAFGTNEFALIVRATALRTDPLSYGAISVSADVPGARIFLDGGYVGRVPEGRPALLKNVRTGVREVRVEDFSGRHDSEMLVVRQGGAAQAVLTLLDIGSVPEAGRGPVPIGKNPQGQEEFWRSKDKAIMVRIPGGEFLAGSGAGQGRTNEQPQRTVDVAGFLIDKHEVTWRQYRKYLDEVGARPPRTPVWGTPPDYPVSFVLWQDAKDYCDWVGGRLPTEREWEKAARGSDGRTYPWGDEWDPERCNSISGGTHSPERIGHFPDCVSPYGVLDMAGSVWEWCEEGYEEGDEIAGDAPADRRIIRGGAWMSQPAWLRTTYRHRVPATTAKADQGFRCVVPE